MERPAGPRIPFADLPDRAYAAVLFDFDGTLADTFPWFCGVINTVADRYRFRRIEAHETEIYRGLAATEILRRLEVPLWKVPSIARHMHGLAARDAQGLSLFPGVPDMLADLEAAGLRLALVSSNDEANVRRVLGPDCAARFRHFACGASLFGKAEKVRAAVKALDVPVQAALAVGDEIRDLVAARAVGCAFAAVAWGYTRADALLARGPDLLFEEPETIAPILRQGIGGGASR